MEEQPFVPVEDDYMVYTYNRFQACRFGLDAVYVDPATGTHMPLREHILATLDRVEPYARKLGAGWGVQLLAEDTRHAENDARWLREKHARERLLAEMVRQASLRFRAAS